jgi:hypothetical protein
MHKTAIYAFQHDYELPAKDGSARRLIAKERDVLLQTQLEAFEGIVFIYQKRLGDRNDV